MYIFDIASQHNTSIVNYKKKKKRILQYKYKNLRTGRIANLNQKYCKIFKKLLVMSVLNNMQMQMIDS